MGVLALLSVLALPFVGAPALHENSHSVSLLEVRGAEVSLELRCQVQSVVEALPIDADRDGLLSEAELDAARGTLEAYVAESYVVRDSKGHALPPTLEHADLRVRGEGFFAEPWVVLQLGLPATEPLEELHVEVSLFREHNAFHRDSCALRWNGEEEATWLFGIDGAAWHFQPAAVRRPSVFVSYLRLGAEHLLGGWDHIAFVLALLVAARSVRGLVGTVTAFTLAHSVTLALAALEVVNVPARLVELAIAMSVAYLGAEGLLFRRPSGRAFEAFCFGLVHGLGFASFVGESLYSEPLKVTALFGFNLGVELGQLAIVLVGVAVIRLLPGDRSGPGAGEDDTLPRAWLAPRWLRLLVSGAVALLGALWFAERAGWLG